MNILEILTVSFYVGSGVAGVNIIVYKAVDIFSR